MNSAAVETQPGGAVYSLSSASCAVAVAARGSRILSLQNLETGREWLWAPSGNPRQYIQAHGPGLPLRPMFGLDECIPTIAPCTVNGTDYPDHGEAWTEPWAINRTALERGTIATEVTLRTSGLHLQRAIMVEHQTVRLCYTVRNISPHPRPYIWSLHPLLKWEPGDSIQLSSTVTQVRMYRCNRAAIPPGTMCPWPVPSAGIALDRGHLGDGGRGFAKVFVGPESGGAASVWHRRTGETVTVRWNLNENPWLGLWICSGGRNGYFHVGLEPTTSPHDSLGDACVTNTAAWIDPGATRTWSISLEVASRHSSDQRGPVSHSPQPTNDIAHDT